MSRASISPCSATAAAAAPARRCATTTAASPAQKHKDLPKELSHLAWLDLDSADGREYWAAMELMGQYAAANHILIHHHIARHLGAGVLLDIENHHNFAWKERHGGRDLIVHRKGATPAGAGVLGIIPGSMASADVCGARQGQCRVAQLRLARRGPGDEPHKARESFNWKRCSPFWTNAA